MTIDLGGVDCRLGWANKQIVELNAMHSSFRNRRPYEVVIDPNPDRPEQPGHSHVCLRINEPAATQVITEVELRAGDIVHSLRAALDNLAWAVVPDHGPNTAFPIWRRRDAPKPAQYESLVSGKVSGAPDDVINVFLGLEPYFGGSHEALRTLDYLDTVDRHRLLFAAFASHQDGEIDFGGDMPGALTGDSFHIPDFGVAVIPAQRFPLADGHVLFSGPLEQIQAMPQDPTIQIAFGEPPTLRSKPVVLALTELARFVAGVVAQFKVAI